MLSECLLLGTLSCEMNLNGGKQPSTTHVTKCSYASSLKWHFLPGEIPKSYTVDVKQMQKNCQSWKMFDLSILPTYTVRRVVREMMKAKIAVSELLGLVFFCFFYSWGFKCQNLLNANFLTTCRLKGIQKKSLRAQMLYLYCIHKMAYAVILL